MANAAKMEHVLRAIQEFWKEGHEPIYKSALLTDSEAIIRELVDEALTDHKQPKAIIKQVAMFWAMDFGQMVNQVELCYHTWQTAEDNRRRNRKAENDDELSHKATVFRSRYNEARSALYQWVCEHPAPEGAMDL